MSTQHPRSRDLPRGEAAALPRCYPGADSEFHSAGPRSEQHDERTAAFLQDSGGSDRQCEAMASSCGDGKGRVPEKARPLRLQCSDCEELLHDLASVLTGVLMQSQMMAWKLPPYSHLKRSVREIERNAQRGSELMKRIMRRLADGEKPVPGQPAAARVRKRAAAQSHDLT